MATATLENPEVFTICGVRCFDHGNNIEIEGCANRFRVFLEGGEDGRQLIATVAEQYTNPNIMVRDIAVAVRRSRNYIQHVSAALGLEKRKRGGIKPTHRRKGM